MPLLIKACRNADDHFLVYKHGEGADNFLLGEMGSDLRNFGAQISINT